MVGFGKRLRELRGSAKQTDAAQELGINYSTYAMYEVDRREPNFDTLVSVAKHYGVTTDYLLGISDCKSPDIEEQAICKKTGLWYNAVKKLIEIQNHQRKAIIGEDPEGLMDSDEIPAWMYEVFSLYINLFILNDSTPFLASKSMHVVEAIKKDRALDLEALDKARAAAAEIDPDFHVLAPHEDEIFYRHIVERYARKITTKLIDEMRKVLSE